MRAFRRIAAGVVPALLATLSLGCATDSVEKTKKQVARAVAVLQRDRDPDSLAAAALMRGSFMLGNDHESASSLIARATAAAPDRPDLAWLQAVICQQTRSCDPRPLESRLRALDPANGAGWLGELARAWTARDDEKTDAALRAMGQTDRVDAYYTGLLAKLTPKLSDAGSITLEEALIAVTGALAGEAISTYHSASQACKGERLARSDVLSSCRGVARAFGNGDTAITEMIGVVIAKRVWPEGSPQWNAAAEGRRVYDYRSKLLLEVDSTLDAISAQRYLALCGKYRREHDVFREELLEAGRDPDPPSAP